MFWITLYFCDQAIFFRAIYYSFADVFTTYNSFILNQWDLLFNKKMIFFLLYFMHDQIIEMMENSMIHENVEPLIDNQICETILEKKNQIL